MRIKYRNLAILTLVLCGIVLLYKDPIWVVELLYPDHWSDQSKPDDSMIFVICILGLITGAIIVMLDRDDRPPRQ